MSKCCSRSFFLYAIAMIAWVFAFLPLSQAAGVEKAPLVQNLQSSEESFKWNDSIFSKDNFLDLVVPSQAYSDESLLEAISNNDISGVTKALDDGANPNAIDTSPTKKFACRCFRSDYGLDYQNWPALMVAVFHGNAEIVKLLIANGADVNYQDKSGIRPVSVGLISENEEALFSVIRAGAELDFKIGSMHESSYLEDVMESCWWTSRFQSVYDSVDEKVARIRDQAIEKRRKERAIKWKTIKSFAQYILPEDEDKASGVIAILMDLQLSHVKYLVSLFRKYPGLLFRLDINFRYNTHGIVRELVRAPKSEWDELVGLLHRIYRGYSHILAFWKEWNCHFWLSYLVKVPQSERKSIVDLAMSNREILFNESFSDDYRQISALAQVPRGERIKLVNLLKTNKKLLKRSFRSDWDQIIRIVSKIPEEEREHFINARIN